MRILILFSFFSLALQDSNEQVILTDTFPTTVQLNKYNVGKKVVKAEYGKVIMYFKQKDYFGKELKDDTVRVTPKYFDDYSISKLLKKGKAKVWRRSTQIFQDSIRHRLKQFASMADREFEFTDGTCFFINLEIIGIMGAIYFPKFDSSKPQKKEIVIPQKKFEYDEEFAKTNDTSSIKIRDYFPVKPLGYYVYDSDNEYGETDTNQCKLTKIKGIDVFYFAECYNKYSLISIDWTMFGAGLYFYRNDSLFTMEAEYEKDIQEKDPGDALLLLPAFMIPGDSIIINLNSHKNILTYLSREDVTIKGTTYYDCIKFKMLECWDDTIYLEYIWLKKDVGMIKWMRSTGRRDEFINLFYKR